MALKFTQNEIESALRDVLKHGDIRDLSIITGIYETYLAGQFNPNDPRKSVAFCFLQIQCALDEIDEERGDQFWDAVARFRKASNKPKPRLDARCETVLFNKESRDVVDIQLIGGTPEEKLKEITEARRQLAKLEDAVLQEMNAAKPKLHAA